MIFPFDLLAALCSSKRSTFVSRRLHLPKCIDLCHATAILVKEHRFRERPSLELTSMGTSWRALKKRAQYGCSVIKACYKLYTRFSASHTRLHGLPLSMFWGGVPSFLWIFFFLITMLRNCLSVNWQNVPFWGKMKTTISYYSFSYQRPRRRFLLRFCQALNRMAKEDQAAPRW